MARIIGKGYSFDDVLIIPKYNKIYSRRDVNLKTRVTRNYFIDIPILAANMDTVCDSKMAIALGKLGGLGVVHRFLTIEEQVEEVKKVKKNNLLCAAAIGVKDLESRVKKLNEVGVQILVIDIAHGHSKRAGKALDYLKENYPNIDIMAGNIATKDAAEYFLSKGADAVKVGIGPGSLCTTRIMTGAGVPQLTAIMDVYEATKGEIPICADGGIKKSADIVKALGAGADNVMLGFMLAGTDESPGEISNVNGEQKKLYRGSASYSASVKKAEINGDEDTTPISVEGEQTYLKYKGSIHSIIPNLLGGLASGMTYMGAKEMKSLIGKADFIEITSSGQEESKANALYC